MQQQSSFKQTGGVLYLVPTPIGNLEDMTFRAIRILKQADLIAAEDTRNTQKLLNHFEIKTKQISFHEHNTQQRILELLEKLKQGQIIAQVSDAGMPSISDPGKELVQAAIAHQIAVVPLPGANAALTGLIASGILPQPFSFYGFLPRKNSELKQMAEQLLSKEETLLFYEAPHRLAKTLANLATILPTSRQVVLARELTKKHEEFIRGTLKECLEWATTQQMRGEFVIIIAGNQDDPVVSVVDETSVLPIKEQVLRQIQQGAKPNEAIKTVAKANQLKKQVVYNAYHDLKDEE